MNKMRQFALAFLTFLIVVPSLACAMPVCKDEAAAAQPCHPTSHEQQSEAEADTADGVMLLVDCMTVDLFAQDTASTNLQPDQSVDTLDFAWADITATHGFEPRNINAIRGPPITDSATSPSRPLYLTTQRFRI